MTEGENLSTFFVNVGLYQEVTGEHEYGCWIDCKDGNHKRMCKNCCEWETEEHKYVETTHKCECGAYDPKYVDVKISVDVKEKTVKQYIGFFPWGFYKDVTTYTATIQTDAVGVKVTKVEYQLNGSDKWIPGTVVCSDKPIENLNVKVTDSNGKNHEYTYPAPVV